MSLSRTTLLLAAAGTVIGILLLVSPEVPLGVPGEWTWSRRDASFDLYFGMVLAIGVGALGVGAATWVRDRIDMSPRWFRGLAVAGLYVGTLTWWIGLLELTPGPTGISRLPWVLYFPGSSGYFTQATTEVQSARTFLSGYEQRVTEADGMDRYLHLGTHPPGLTLSFYGLVAACERWPALVSISEATQPSSIRQSFKVLRETGPRNCPLTRPQAAALWLASVTVMLGAAMGGPAIYGLVRRCAEHRIAWSAAVFWPLVPGVIIFLPKSDSLFGGLAPALALLWLTAVDRRSYAVAIVFGATLYFCLSLSLAFLPVALLIAIQSIVETVWNRSRTEVALHVPAPVQVLSPRQRVIVLFQLCIVALLGFMAPVIGLKVWAGYSTSAVWMQNLRNHAEFYQHSPRTYFAWLPVNIAELAFSLGIPAIVALVVVLRLAIREFQLRSMAVAWIVVFGILWLSGKNMGEAARLWCFHLAWPIALLSTWSLVQPQDVPRAGGRRWVQLLGLQMIVCVVTVMMVSGFDFGLSN